MNNKEPITIVFDPEGSDKYPCKVAVAFDNQSYRLGNIHGISLYKS